MLVDRRRSSRPRGSNRRGSSGSAGWPCPSSPRSRFSACFPSAASRSRAHLTCRGSPRPRPVTVAPASAASPSTRRRPTTSRLKPSLPPCKWWWPLFGGSSYFFPSKSNSAFAVLFATFPSRDAAKNGFFPKYGSSRSKPRTHSPLFPCLSGTLTEVMVAPSGKIVTLMPSPLGCSKTWAVSPIVFSAVCLVVAARTHVCRRRRTPA